MPLLGRLARMAGHLFGRCYANHCLPLAILYWVASCAVLAHWLWKRKQRNTPSTKEKHRAMSCCFFLKIFISLAPDNPTILSQTHKTQILEPINIHTLKTRCQCHPKIPKEFPKKKNKSSLFPLKIRQELCIIPRRKLLFLLMSRFFLSICRHVPIRNAGGGLLFGLKCRRGRLLQLLGAFNSQQLLTNPFISL